MSRWLSQLAEVQTKHQNGEEMGFKWLWMWYGSTLPSVLKAQLPSHFDSLLNESYSISLGCPICDVWRVLDMLTESVPLCRSWRSFASSWSSTTSGRILTTARKWRPSSTRCPSPSLRPTGELDEAPSQPHSHHQPPPQWKRFWSSSDQGPYSEAPLSSALNSV